MVFNLLMDGPRGLSFQLSKLMVSWKLFAVTYYLANFEYVASVGNGCPTSAYSKLQQSIV
jgi:hypothetical protein